MNTDEIANRKPFTPEWVEWSLGVLKGTEDLLPQLEAGERGEIPRLNTPDLIAESLSNGLLMAKILRDVITHIAGKEPPVSPSNNT